MLITPGLLSLEQLQRIHASVTPLELDPACRDGIRASAALVQAAADGDAAAFVAARVGEGSDYIKLIIEDMSAYSATTRIPTIAEAQTKSAIAAAHQTRKLAVVHVSRLSEGKLAIAAGADGLAAAACIQPAAVPPVCHPRSG